MPVESREEFEDWLRAQSKETCVAVASRAALRVFPIVTHFDSKDDAKFQLALLTARAILTSGVAAVSPTPEVRAAAARAAAAADAADAARAAAAAHAADAARAAAFAAAAADAAARAAAADAAARAAARAARAARAAADAADAAAYLDTDVPRETLLETPLWHEPKEPEWLVSALIPFANILEKDPEWTFWRRWYRGFLIGEPLDWELQVRVALIPDEDWEKGPAHIADKIEKITLEFQTSVGETIYRDEEAGVFRLRPEARLPTEPVQFARERIELALSNALRNGAANGFREESYEADVIRTVLDKYPNDGSLLAVNFFDGCMSLEKNIGDVYPEDTSLVILKNALYTTVEELCELDEKAKERVQRLVKLGLPAEMLTPDRDAVREIPDKIADLTDAELDRRIREASDIVANSQKPPRVWRARLTNWITTISIWMDHGIKNDKRLKWLADLVDRMRNWWPDAE